MNRILNQLLTEKRIKYKGGLYHKTQVLLAYNSNRIEGSQLSEEQTQHIFDTHTFLPNGNNAIRVDDVIETTNHFILFDYMLDTIDKPLSETMIKEYHRILKAGTSDSALSWFAVGDYKKMENEVGGMNTVSPSNVKHEMQKLLTAYNKIQVVHLADIADFHALFECIHPFQDGNGRVGRVVMFRECLKNNIMPFIVDERHRAYYYRGLKEYKNDKGYLIGTFESAQDIYTEYCERLIPQKTTIHKPKDGGYEIDK